MFSFVYIINILYFFDRFQYADFPKKVQNFGKSHSIFLYRRFNRKWYEYKKNKKNYLKT